MSTTDRKSHRQIGRPEMLGERAYVSITQAAEILSVSRAVVQRLIENEIPSIRIGRGRGVIRIPSNALRAYITTR